MASSASPASVECAACGLSSPPGKNFCADCGARLTPATESVNLEARVKAMLDDRVKDQKIVELETAQAVVTRVIDWAKLFGWLVAVPLGLLAVTLAVWGISSFVDFRRLVEMLYQVAQKYVYASMSSPVDQRVQQTGYALGIQDVAEALYMAAEGKPANQQVPKPLPLRSRRDATEHVQ